VLALGIATFALLTMLALLAEGIKTTKVSVDETQAIGILTAVEADMRNTHPLLNAGASSVFGFPLPYSFTSPGPETFSTTIAAGTLYSKALTQAQVPTANTTAHQPFEASVIYTRLPAAGSLEPVEARLIVNWPYLNGGAVADLTNPAKVSGYVETYVTFPAP
jgi:hypothetical protein